MATEVKFKRNTLEAIKQTPVEDGSVLFSTNTTDIFMDVGDERKTYNSETLSIDDTLTQSGKAADAKVTGDNIGELSEEINNKVQVKLITFDYNGVPNLNVDENTLTLPKCFVNMLDGSYKQITEDVTLSFGETRSIFNVYFNGETFVHYLFNVTPSSNEKYVCTVSTNRNSPLITGFDDYTINGVRKIVNGQIVEGHINNSNTKTLSHNITKIVANGQLIDIISSSTTSLNYSIIDTFSLYLRKKDYALVTSPEQSGDILIATISKGKVVYGNKVLINSSGELLNGKKIWCFGDSLTAGVSMGTETITESYPYNLGVLSPGSVISNFGVPGADILAIRDVIKSKDFFGSCDIAIIMGGCNGYLPIITDFDTDKNDITTKIGAYCDAIKYIIDNSHGTTKIVMINTPKFNRDGVPDRWKTELHYNTQRIAKEFDVLCVDAYSFLGGSPTDTLYYSTDQVHLNACGYYALAKLIYEQINNGLAMCNPTCGDIEFNY